MKFTTIIAGAIIFLLSLNLGASELDNLRNEVEEFHRQHPIHNKEHYKWEVAQGGTKYADISLSFKNRVLAYGEQLFSLDEEIKSKIKTKDDLKKWKWQLDELDREYESTLKQMKIVVDHIVAHTYNIGSYTGELLLYCDGAVDIYDEYLSAMDEYSRMEYVVEARERKPHSFISSGEWGKYLSENSLNPSLGIQCENVISNAEHTIHQAKSLRKIE